MSLKDTITKFNNIETEPEGSTYDPQKLADATLYAGYFFDKKEVDKLANMVPNRKTLSKDIATPHITTVFRPTDIVPEDVGAKTNFKIIGYANDGKNEGFKIADTSEMTPYSLGKLQERQKERNTTDLGLHITLSISKDGKAVDTAFLDFKDLSEPMQISGSFCIVTKDNKMLTNSEDINKYMKELETKEKEKALLDPETKTRQANFDKYCSSKIIGTGVIVNSGGINHFLKVSMPEPAPVVTEQAPNIFLSDSPNVDVSIIGDKVPYHITGYNNYGCIENIELTIDDKTIKPETLKHLEDFTDTISHPSVTISCSAGIPHDQVHTSFNAEQSNSSVVRGTVGVMVEGKDGPEWLVSQDDIDRYTKAQMMEQDKNLKFEDLSVKEKFIVIDDTKSIVPDKSDEIIMYWDMDGVLADFDKGVKDMTSFDKAPNRESTKEDKTRFWEEVRDAKLYSKLDAITDTIDVLRKLKEEGIKTEILTGIPLPKSVPDAVKEKEEWAAKHVGSDIKVNTCMAKDKILKCTGPNCILIDDSEKNCEAWRAAGGTAILFDGNVEELKKSIQITKMELQEKSKPIERSNGETI